MMDSTISAHHQAVLNASLEYSSYGWRSVIAHGIIGGKCTCGKPSCSMGKHPRLNEWQKHATANEETIAEWFESWPTSNLGVQLGPTSGIVDFESDNDDGERLIAEMFGGEIPVCPIFTSGRGKHRLFRWRDDLPRQANLPLGCADLKLGANDAGSQSIFPPSMHASGKQYEWLIPPSEVDPPEIPDCVIHWLESRGKKNGKSTNTTNNTTTNNTSGKILDGKRNGTLTAMAGAMRKWDFPPDVIEQAIVTTNKQRCSPPLDDSEARQIATSILRYKPDQEQVADDKPLFPIVSAAELLSSNYSFKWHVRSLLVQGQPAVIAGPKKALKTSLALAMSISIVTGFPLFNRFEIPETARVAFMSAESGAFTIQETVARICDSLGIVDDELGTRAEKLSGLNFCWNVPRFDHVAHLVQLEKFIDDTGAQIVFYDPTYMCMGGADAGNIFEMGERLKNVSQLCTERGVTPILVHHFKKGRNQESDTPDLGDIAWSGFGEFARQWILLDREEEYVPGSGEHKILFAWGGSAGHSGALSLNVSEGVNNGDGGRYWAVEALDRKAKADRKGDAKAKAQQAKVDACREAIDAAFRSAKGEPLTKPDLATRAGHDQRAKPFLDALATMLREGKVEPTTITKANKIAYEAYRRLWGKGDLEDVT
jgi:hypothetical protein